MTPEELCDLISTAVNGTERYIKQLKSLEGESKTYRGLVLFFVPGTPAMYSALGVTKASSKGSWALYFLLTVPLITVKQAPLFGCTVRIPRVGWLWFYLILRAILRDIQDLPQNRQFFSKS
jgi:hypothetical protein